MENPLTNNQPIGVHGALTGMFEVYHGPTADGPWQVHVTMQTSDQRGYGMVKSIVDIEPDTSPERVAAIVHECALALLAHELLECIGTEDGRPMLDPHAGGKMQTVPDVASPMFRPANAGDAPTCSVSFVVPARLSHTGEARRKEGQVDSGVAEIVRRLNHPIFGDEPITEQSCEGHGDWYPYVQLVDGETMLIVPTEDVRRIEAVMRQRKLEGPAIGWSGASA